MNLTFKPDFNTARDQWRRFWRGELDHPLAAAVVPKEGVEPVDKPPYMAGWDGDFGPAIDRMLRYAETHHFLGAALPYFYLTFGPDHFSALLGAELKFNPDSASTSWCVPFVEDWDDAAVRFDRDGLWWQRTVAFIREFRRRTGDAILIAGPTLVANLDALSAIREPGRLLLDMAMAPDKVHRALDQVGRAYEEILAALTDELGVAQLGQINRHGMFTPDGPTNIPQVDFSCMIGPEMFREFAVPALEREAAPLDAAEYHLDGPDAIRHLEAVCGIEKVRVIQWVPGAGAAARQDWTDLYARIDALGCGQIRGGDFDTLQRLWREHTSPLLYYRLSAADRTEAEGLLERAQALRTC